MSQASEAPTPSRRQRFLPWFSLRTLLILVLLIGSSSIGLWYRWEPWVEVWNFDHTSEKVQAFFSPDDHLAAVHLRSSGEVLLLDALTGKIVGYANWIGRGKIQLSYLRDSSRLCVFEFDQQSSTWKYWQLEPGKETTEAAHLPLQGFGRCLPAFNGEQLIFENPFRVLRKADASLVLSVGNNIPAGAIVALGEEMWAKELAAIATNRPLDAKNLREFCARTKEMRVNSLVSTDGAYLFTNLLQDRKGIIWDLQTNERICDLELPPEGLAMGDSGFLTSGGRHFLFSYLADDGWRTAVHDGRSGTRLADLPGMPIADTRLIFAEMSSNYLFTIDDDSGILAAWNLNTLSKEWEGKLPDSGFPYPLGDRNHIVVSRYENPFSVEILDMNSGSVLHSFPEYFHEAHAHDGETILLNKDDQLRAFRRRRPEQWWGVAWLPEFWLTFLFLIALLWSLRRDFKTLRKAKAA